jgi:hypothetical protein
MISESALHMNKIPTENCLNTSENSGSKYSTICIVNSKVQTLHNEEKQNSKLYNPKSAYKTLLWKV